ncbi:MAG TPA: peptide ABC transporter substrate-binding protein [Steroidobacteraceae bacterium]|nr:peptide ABC transporter substrate-binding protein [Steroidobacteraceae bacterium]
MRQWTSVLCCLLLVACGAPGRSTLSDNAIDARIASGHLHRHLSQAPRTLDPSLNEDVAAYSIADDLFEGLVRLDAGGNVVPGVASGWDVSDQGLTWRFHLRPEARWSNGDPVRARDFVYAWRRIMDPATGSVNRAQLTPIAGAEAIQAGSEPLTALGVRALDDRTLEVRLASPTPYFLYLLTLCWFMPLHEPTIRRHGTAWTEPAHIVGNGAFVLRSRTASGPLTLARNPFYWDAAAVKLKAVTYHPVTDTAAATARFLAGDLDITDRFQLEDLDWLRRDLAGQVRLEPYFATYMMAMNVTRPPFDDVRVRQALVMALDREVLTGKLLQGKYSPAYGIVPPLPGYDTVMPEWAALPAGVRHARARELYAAAGYSPRKPLQVQLWYPMSDSDTRRVMEGMAAMWRTTLGANVRIETEEWRAYQQDRMLRQHGLFYYTWTGDYPDPLTFLALALTGGDQNHMQYSSDRYDAAVAEGRRAVDAAARQAAYQRAERILYDDAVVLPIYYYRSKHLVRGYVQGWQQNSMDRHASRGLYLAREPQR